MKFTVDGNDYWVGITRAWGILVFDPSKQFNVDEDRVLLFVLKSKSFEDFHKKTARQFFVNVKGLHSDEASRTVQEYHTKHGHDRSKGNARYTYCYRCHKALSTDYDVVCTQCSWIKCSCGACGC